MITLNGLVVTSAQLTIPNHGTWTAEVAFDLSLVPVLPTGRVALVIGTTLLSGTIDADASGAHGPSGHARIIGGGAGWHKEVQARHFHNDAGVLSTEVISSTAAEVGEVAVDTLPTRLGVDFMRLVGPASRALAERDWFVTLAGVTTVGPRLPMPVNPLTVEILDWDPHERRATIGTNEILTPGMLLVDPRIGGTATIRDVEQLFDESGSRATVYCGEPTASGSKLSSMFRNLVEEHGQTANNRVYHYRVVLQGPDGRLTLQAIDRELGRAAGAPDSLALPDWYGVPGFKSVLVTPGSECAVVFLDGNPTKPVVIAYKGGDELSTGVATQASQAAFVAALATLATTFEAFLNFPGVAAVSGTTAQPVAAAIAALATVAALPTSYSIRTKAP